MAELPNRLKRALHQVAGKAYEEELRRELLPLAAKFDQWKARQVNSSDLAKSLNDFSQGPGRELFKKYDGGTMVMAVSRAIATGIVDRAHVPTELLEHLREPIELFASERK